MRTISIGYSNFWGRDDTFTADYFYKMFPFLREYYKFVLRDEPDVMIFSVYGYIHKKASNSIRVLISGEAGDHFAEGGKIAPEVFDPEFFHFGLTCAADNNHPNHIYLPQPYIMLNLYNNGLESLIRGGIYIPPEKKCFCDFIYSNGNSRDRIEFCILLSKYKRIECAGAVNRNTEVLVNTGYDQAGYLAKQAFQSQCKFSIAFENNYYPGYITEKLSDPFVARSVPIYSGNPVVDTIFNPKSFINVDKFTSWEAAIDYIKMVDGNDRTYDAYLAQPPFVDNKIPEQYSDETYLKFFKRIFE